MDTNNLNNILGTLKNVTRSGSGFTARCPAHDDHRNSLSIGKGRDGRVLLFCHAGCEVGNILRALDIKMGDLFPGQTSWRRYSQ